MASERRQGRTGTVGLEPTPITMVPHDTTVVETLEDEPLRPETTQVQAHMGRTLEPLAELPPGVGGQLKVLQGPSVGIIFELEHASNTLGRTDGNDIVIPDAAVSARHASIYFSTTREWRIRDLDSTNGTLLNGSRVVDFALRDGDKFVVGGCRLAFILS